MLFLYNTNPYITPIEPTNHRPIKNPMEDSEEYYGNEQYEYKTTEDDAIAAEYDDWAHQYSEEYHQDDQDQEEKKWVRPTQNNNNNNNNIGQDAERVRKPPPSPPPEDEPPPPSSDVKFYKPRGNPVETLRSSAEISRAMLSYVDNLSVQEGSCREIIRLCKVNEATRTAREHAYSQERMGAAAPEEIIAAKIAANRPLETKLSADEAVNCICVEIYSQP